MSPTQPSEGYLLIVTYGRSGSTLLQNILLSIDGYSIKGENNNVLMPLFQAYKRAKFAKEKFGNKPKPKDRPWYGAEKIRPHQFAQRLVQSFIDEIIVPDTNARVVGFKEIRFQEVGADSFPEFMDFIRTFLSPCKIIFNVRNAKDVAKSAWYKSMNSTEVIEEITSYGSWYRDYADRHPQDCFVLSYDAYKENTDSLKPLFDFLDEQFDEKKLRQILNASYDYTKKTQPSQ